MIYNKKNNKYSNWLTKENKFEDILLIIFGIIGNVLGVLILLGVIKLNIETEAKRNAMGIILISMSSVATVLTARKSRKKKQSSFIKLLIEQIENNSYKNNIVLNYGIDADLIDAQILLESVMIGIEYSYGVYAEVVVDKSSLYFCIEYTDEFFEKYFIDEELLEIDEEIKIDNDFSIDQVYKKLIDFYNNNMKCVDEFIKKYIEK